VIPPKEQPASPARRGTEQDEKSDADEPSREIAFAPALEHSHQSNHEQENCDHRERFQKHANLLE
jgi:hypothetical protein